ncbi:hypothetical protein LPB86_04545 [Pedobacter sp. MC2016-14]|uniref:hypothetical protein n=1 Tax=Pedobacter sp. MC2016-14 TaxID=2897327 RepID=UPI001E651126|nr:hypothetical protein [Pedobacter sp. MC2016-14]MCD0487483.1 hypothetical protein [Pedobacter sp. MC2016-14]
MKKGQLLRAAVFAAVIASITLGGCSKDNEPTTEEPQNDTRWITLTAALKQTADGDGNGGTLAYAISHDQAINPAYELDIFPVGKGLKLESPRTSRVQASADGKYLYDIQYTGADGGIFQKFRVDGEGKYVRVGNEVNTAIILGTSPRWVKSAEGVGIGVSIATETAYTGTFPAVTFGSIKSTAAVASLNLDNPSILNTASFDVPFTPEQLAQGYSITRIDVPIINQAKNKVYIGGSISKVNPAGTPTQNTTSGVVSWPSDAANIAGTVTIVLDYPTLKNPKVIWSTQSKYGNNGYRTMVQHIGDDGHVYQATGVNTTGYPHILRIDKNTNDYDNTYLFNLSQALGVNGIAGIKAWRYLGNNKGFVMYDIDKTGGYLALIDLNTKTATKIPTEYEARLNFDQHQSIAVQGDFVYVPLTPVSEAGNVFVYNWKTGVLTKGAKLANGTGHRFIGAY